MVSTRRTLRLTHDGLLYLALVGALTVVGIVAGNNALMVVAAPLWSLWLLQWPLGSLNLRGITVRRVLPAELYAEHDGTGAWLVGNPGRWLAARDVRLEEVHATAVSAASVAPGQSVRVATAWRFPRRGIQGIDRVRMSSSWPFGLVEHVADLSLSADVLVYPRPIPGERRVLHRPTAGAVETPRLGGSGDFLGLRPFREGDPPQRVSWSASARVGAPMVVERAVEHERAVQIALRSARGAAWERELSRACGEVHRAVRGGDAVGLVVPGDDGTVALALEPVAGLEGRRRVLDALARLPERR